MDRPADTLGSPRRAPRSDPEKREASRLLLLGGDQIPVAEFRESFLHLRLVFEVPVDSLRRRRTVVVPRRTWGRSPRTGRRGFRESAGTSSSSRTPAASPGPTHQSLLRLHCPLGTTDSVQFKRHSFVAKMRTLKNHRRVSIPAICAETRLQTHFTEEVARFETEHTDRSERHFKPRNCPVTAE